MENIEVNNNLWFVNIGEPKQKQLENHQNGIEKHTLRKWENSIQFGFFSAGQGRRWSDQLNSVKIGDIVCAYITQRGFVGIGVCTAEKMAIKEFKTTNGKYLKEVNLVRPTFILEHNIDNPELCEYVIGVKWIDKLCRQKENAVSVSGYNLGITQHIVCNMDDKKVSFIQQKFKVNFLFSNGRIVDDKNHPF